MPLGFERLNVRKQPPNKLVTFVAALNGPDKAIAQDFLERIAAIVYPIMRDNGLAVMSLDEFPPNSEFWGRNFNAGECIQLVLKNPKTGLWLPFQFVQGVMIHELAHIKQMNHSRAFWAVNNKFSGELGVLQSKGYTGEGFWSAGRVLISAEYTQNQPLAESDMPLSLCGGTYRSRGRRRKNRPADDSQSTKKTRLTYAERQQRKKEKKFGLGEGNKVGADEDTRASLENGKSKNKGVPKVAHSNRGRELRAAAALKRFEAQEKEAKVLEEDNEGWSGHDTDYETVAEEEDKKAIDVGGGNFLIPVSREQDGKTEQDEMKKELLRLVGVYGTGDSGCYVPGSGKQDVAGDNQIQKLEPRTATTAMETQDKAGSRVVGHDPASQTRMRSSGLQSRGHNTTQQAKGPSDTNLRNRLTTQGPVGIHDDGTDTRKLVCSACSVANESNTVLCIVCVNVLKPHKMPDAWRCPSLVCSGSTYRNAGDAGICNVCGQRKGTLGASK